LKGIGRGNHLPSIIKQQLKQYFPGGWMDERVDCPDNVLLVPEYIIVAIKSSGT
jgi:hypothetical protein